MDNSNNKKETEPIKKKEHKLMKRVSAKLNSGYLRFLRLSLQTKIIFILVTILIVTFTSIFCYYKLNSEEENHFVSDSNLTDIIQISDLYSYRMPYRGICEIKNKKHPEIVDYRVNYTGTLTVGIDIDKININTDKENHEIVIKLPTLKYDVKVEEGSLDYMFLNNDAETQFVFTEAYNYCVEDIKADCYKNNGLKKLGKDNIQQIITALIEPLSKNYEDEYTIKFIWEGEKQ